MRAVSANGLAGTLRSGTDSGKGRMARTATLGRSTRRWRALHVDSDRVYARRRASSTEGIGRRKKGPGMGGTDRDVPALLEAWRESERAVERARSAAEAAGNAAKAAAAAAEAVAETATSAAATLEVAQRARDVAAKAAQHASAASAVADTKSGDADRAVSAAEGARAAAHKRYREAVERQRGDGG